MPGKLSGYAALAEATGITTPVLVWLPTSRREVNARRVLARAQAQLTEPHTVPVATAAAALLDPDAAHPSPADEVWLPLDPEGRCADGHSPASPTPGPASRHRSPRTTPRPARCRLRLADAAPATAVGAQVSASVKTAAVAAAVVLLIPVLIGAAAAGVVASLFTSGGGADCAPAGASPRPEVAGYDPEQLANAATIVAVGKQMRVPEYGWVIAIAAAMQESRLHNLDYGTGTASASSSNGPRKAGAPRRRSSTPATPPPSSTSTCSPCRTGNR
ncbi:hypothetical protein HNR02_005116 [Amycolatopsis endophytica]|uniref:Uncharacterized protein n=1 Tax=Amycolatopsis endophytica TaxID=860233 RepID=A0A853B900_9PSEU|nr:hypothetical protein [Amycolatopsis endophytica]